MQVSQNEPFTRALPPNYPIQQVSVALQAAEFTRFRLTRPFHLAYTPLIASFREFPGYQRPFCLSSAVLDLAFACSVFTNDAVEWKVMALLTRFIRFLFLVVIVSWGFRLLGRYISGLLQSGHPVPPADPERDLNRAKTAQLLVRDPVCGVHIAETLAIPLHEAGRLQHFCSIACRDTYVNSSRKLAANG